MKLSMTILDLNHLYSVPLKHGILVEALAVPADTETVIHPDFSVEADLEDDCGVEVDSDDCGIEVVSGDCGIEVDSGDCGKD